MTWPRQVNQSHYLAECVKINLIEAVELYLESAKELGILQEIVEEAGLKSEELKEEITIQLNYSFLPIA